MEKFIESDGIFAKVINWFWQYLVVKVIVTLFVGVFLSGFMMIWNMKSIILDIKNDCKFFDKSEVNYKLDIILYILFTILALFINIFVLVRMITMLG